MNSTKGRKKAEGTAPLDNPSESVTPEAETSKQTDPIIPSYSSIFNANYYRRGSNSPQLKKPSGVEYTEQTTLRLSSLEQNRKQFSNDTAPYNKAQEIASDDDNHEMLDERLPLSNAKTNRNSISSKRVSPTESAGSHQAYNGKRLQITNFDHYPVTTSGPKSDTGHHHHHSQLANPSKHSPHSKISFSADHHGRHNTNQPTSFGGDHHQVGECHFGSHSKRLDWQESGSCLDCDCNNCYIKFKNAMLHESNCCRRFNDLHSSSKNISSKTRNIHMVLKSIILVLLTLLLLMIFVGIIVASHYLPQVFDRLLSATRSFNVTIAG